MQKVHGEIRLHAYALHFLRASCVLIFMLFASQMNAQIIFPMGHQRIVNTDKNYLYEETEISIIVRGGIISKYRWQWVWDSVPSTWTVTACINGLCYPDRPQWDTFSRELTENDTAGYFRFHVFTYDHSGAAKVKYRIVNATNAAEDSLMYFEFNYTNPNSIAQQHADAVHVYPNPVNDALYIDHAAQHTEVRIFDLNSKELLNVQINGAGEKIDLQNLPNGLYELHLAGVDLNLRRKIVVLR